ncbi:MAG TPA: heavy metal translocating P-type ATPase [Thermoplasmata archaeon]|nr:heavy metal translocating P-type ATPase [Thermoplasmata archaeon]
MATDPVCGMFVDERPESLQLIRENRTYYFCCSGCLDSFASPEEERRRLARRLAVAWPISGAIVVLTYAVGSRDSAVFAGVLGAVVQGYAGYPFYVGAWEAVRRRIGNMDLLIATGTTAAFGYSVAVIAVPGRLPSADYFDASALIVTLILTGNYLEHRTRLRAGSALRRLGELLPRDALVLRDGGERCVPVGELVVGDRVRVAPGARIPADGTILRGRTHVVESILTGEPGAVEKSPGDSVLAGTVNGDGTVELSVDRTGSDTFVAQIGAVLTEAEMSRVPLQKTADRIARWFVPGVLVLAVAAGLFWRFVGGATVSESVLVFVTVSITACPCAFGLATPAAILVGTGRAAEDGILFRGRDAIERVAQVDTILTDKTGTLTSPEVSVASWVTAPAIGEGDLIATAAGIASGTDHPLSRALRRAAAARGVVPRRYEETIVDPGVGVRSRSGDRRSAIVGAASVRREGTDVAPLESWIRTVEGRGESWSAVVSDGKLLGAVSFGSALRPGVREAVAELRAAGVRLAIVTGDHEPAARSVAERLGISEVHAGASPARKVEVLEAYRRSGRRVGFVGDGVNDAPVLAAADAGFAIGSGTDVARESGQVILVRDDFGGVPGAIGWAERTVDRVRWNLVWAVGYNLVLLPIAAGALVPWFGLGMYRWLPIAGALAMGFSSATVVLNSLTIRRPRPADLLRARPAGEAVSTAPG